MKGRTRYYYALVNIEETASGRERFATLKRHILRPTRRWGEKLLLEEFSSPPVSFSPLYHRQLGYSFMWPIRVAADLAITCWSGFIPTDEVASGMLI